jgi:hypothetical protein
MALNNAKHIVSEIDGIRCSIVETGASLERVAFLTDLLTYNNYEVKELKESSEDSSAEQKYTLGVTDLIFNPVFAVYERLLKTREGSVVTPGYWNENCIECDPRYWIMRKGAKRT